MSRVNVNRLPEAKRVALLGAVNTILFNAREPMTTSEIVARFEEGFPNVVTEVKPYGTVWGLVEGACFALGMTQRWGWR